MKLKQTFRYDTQGSWFKGNTHVHSTASDGGKTIPELAELYSSGGYDFIFITDHWVASDVASLSGQSPLLLIDGIELDGKDHTGAYYHVVCLGRTGGIRKRDGFRKALKKARDQGALLILAHPYWCANTLDDAVRGDFDGVETYNHVCHWLNGKSNGFIHWDAMVEKKNNTLSFAADDAHLRPEHPGWNGGWIVVNTNELSSENILSAIKKGNFYSSCGPEIKSLKYERGTLKIECSPVRFIRLVGAVGNGCRAGSFEGELLENASIKIPLHMVVMKPRLYIEIEDNEGKKAWTNTLFV